MMNSDIIKSIENGECSLGIELGSTRIKGILITTDTKPVASGAFDWENRNDNGVWIYTIDDILTGIHDCYQDLKKDVLEKYGIKLTKLKNMGVSAMMHGYMAFDKDGNLLTPFRTWRNTALDSKPSSEGYKREEGISWESRSCDDACCLCTLPSHW